MEKYVHRHKKSFDYLKEKKSHFAISREDIFQHPQFGTWVRAHHGSSNKGEGFLTFQDEQGNESIVISKNGFWSHILIHQTVRISYLDKEPRQVIYDIQFDSSGSLITKVECSSWAAGGIEMIAPQVLESANLGEGCSKYVFGKDSSIEISIDLVPQWDGYSIEIRRKNGPKLLDLLSSILSSNPLIRFTSCVDRLRLGKSEVFQNQFYHEAFEILNNLAEVDRKNNSQEVRDILWSNVQFMHSFFLYYYFHFLQAEKSEVLENFVQSLIYHGSSVHPLNQKLSKEEALAGFHPYVIQSKDEERIVLRRFSPDGENIGTLLKSAVSAVLAISKKLSTHTNYTVEIVLDSARLDPLSEIEGFQFLDLDQHTPMDFVIIFSQKSSLRFEARRFILTPQNKLIRDRTTAGLHPFFIEICELKRLKKFNVSLDTETAEPGQYTFYGSVSTDKNTGDSFDDHRLFHFRLLSESGMLSLNLESNLKDSLAIIKESLTRQEKPPKWNRVFLKFLPPLSISSEDFLSHFEVLVKALLEEIHALHIEKIIVRVNIINTIHEGPYLFEAFHLLSGSPNFRYREISSSSQTPPPFKTAQEPEKQCYIKAAYRRVYCVYDLPRLIDDAAKEIRRLNDAENSDIDQFVALALDADSLRINPKTDMPDPNFGELIPKSENNDPNIPGIGTPSLLIGIKTNDLGHGIIVDRILIVSNLSLNLALTPIECTYLNAAFRYARKTKYPIDWYPGSFGAEVSLLSGTENLDACASTSREIIYTAHEARIPINIIVDYYNIGAQAYWDAIGAILPETTGLLIMTENGTVALTGEKSLTCALYNKLCSEEVNEHAKKLFPNGIWDLGGYWQVHGPNGEAVAIAKNLFEANKLLLSHHMFRTHPSIQRPGKSVMTPDDKKSLSLIVEKMQRGQCVDRNHLISLLEDDGGVKGISLWKDVSENNIPNKKHLSMSLNPTTIIRETTLGGYPVMIIYPPLGPLTPRDSEIIAKAFFKADGSLPVVVLGSLSGYNSDPGSMIKEQLNYGALIIKSIVEHHGQMIVVNLGNMVGGICVTFNEQLNTDLEVVGLEGSRFQVVGGAVASKILSWDRLIKKRDAHSADLTKLTRKVRAAFDEIGRPIKEDKHIRLAIRDSKGTADDKEKIIEDVFDHIHSTERAHQVGSIKHIIPSERLKEYLVEMIKKRSDNLSDAI